MKEADKLNEANGSPVFGVTKYSDQTQEENAVLFGRKGKAHTPTVEVVVTEPTKNLKDNANAQKAKTNAYSSHGI